MRRRRRNGEVSDALAEATYTVVTKLPWYVDALLAVISYFFLHYVATRYQVNGVHGVRDFLPAILSLLGQYMVPAIFVVGGVISAWHAFRYGFRGKELLSRAGSNNAMEIVSKMNWLEFEQLIGEWFRNQGYEVTQAGGADEGGRAHPDGGIDIELHKDGDLFLVQCKHYRAWKVPVEVVRDMYGVMAARGAAGAFVVTSGQFTEPAKEFAAGRSVTLIDGAQLSKILKQTVKSVEGEIPELIEEGQPTCPSCSSTMVRRTAHRGDNAGNEFWGCSRYPACKGTVSIS